MKRIDQATVIFRLRPEDKQKLQIKALQNSTSVQELLENFVLNYIKEDK